MTFARTLATISLIVAAALVASPLYAIPPVRADLPPPLTEGQRRALLHRKLDQTHRVLYVTAHPDDEDAGLIARIVHGDGCELRLLTLTNGNGGQNEIGPELGDALGILREQELEAAHAYDGATQQYGGMDDFGYSFSIEETLERWGDAALHEIVRTIREFRPTVVLTMRDHGPGGGQHHQATGRLARRAVDVAATDTLPELGSPHTTPRAFAVRWDRERIDHPVFVEVDAYDPVLGASYSAVGWRSRDQHKCQGMARKRAPFTPRAVRLDHIHEARGELGGIESMFDRLAQPGLQNADGSFTPLARMIQQEVASLRDGARLDGEPVGVTRLLGLLARPRLPDDPDSQPAWALELGAKVREFGARSRGLRIVARSSRRFVPRGGTVEVEFHVQSASNEVVAIDWGGETVTITPENGRGSTVVSKTVSSKIPAVLEPHYGSIPIEHTWVDPKFPTVRVAPVEVVPDPNLLRDRAVVALPVSTEASRNREIEYSVSTLEASSVRVSATSRDPRLSFTVPEEPIELRGEGRPQSFTAALEWTGDAPETPVEVICDTSARIESAERTSSSGFQVVDYPHIRPRTIEIPSEVRVQVFACDIDPDARIGFVEGTGDDTLEALRTLGYAPVILDETALSTGTFTNLTTIVLGVRAYKVREDLIAARPALLAWMRSGGHLVVQYNKFEMNGVEAGVRAAGSDSPHAPHPGFQVTRGRVTDEAAPITRLDAAHPFFTTPNAITDADFAGWVQERGHYFARATNDAYVDLIETEDPFPFNSGKKRGALMTTQVGEGRWTYVGLGLFRQLPAAVPGAYRLLANLVAGAPSE